ncbi:MAG: sensor histidine kinase [Roseburia intestinalis]
MLRKCVRFIMAWNGMDGDGEIDVNGYRREDDIYIEVRDNGLGIPEDEVEQLLKENNRVHKRGSGVGLLNVHAPDSGCVFGRRNMVWRYRASRMRNHSQELSCRISSTRTEEAGNG